MGFTWCGGWAAQFFAFSFHQRRWRIIFITLDSPGFPSQMGRDQWGKGENSDKFVKGNKSTALHWVHSTSSDGGRTPFPLSFPLFWRKLWCWPCSWPLAFTHLLVWYISFIIGENSHSSLFPTKNFFITFPRFPVELVRYVKHNMYLILTFEIWTPKSWNCSLSTLC